MEMQEKPGIGSMTEREESRTGAGSWTERDGERQKSVKKQDREGRMKQQGQGARTANDRGKGWGRGAGSGVEQHKPNCIATCYRAEREKLRNRDTEPKKRESWKAKGIATHT